ncbi:MAG: hypothetical protein DI585_02705 [Pseudomonas fluorescens]|nr:MAG: hypothetical protein DI585_02705 [Pseudomonas fluorescens]
MTYIADLRRKFQSWLHIRTAAHILRRDILAGRIQKICISYDKYGRDISLNGTDDNNETWFALNSLGYLSNGLSRFGDCPPYVGEGDVFYLKTDTEMVTVSLERAIRHCRFLKGICVTEAVEKDSTSYTFTAKSA